jgi:hypothetical protein
MARRVVPMWWGGRWEKTLAVFCGHAGVSDEPLLWSRIRRLDDILYRRNGEHPVGVLENRKRTRSLFLG